MQCEAVDVPSKDFLDDGEDSVALEELFGGFYFTACGVVSVVGAEYAVDAVEQVALRGELLRREALLEQDEVVDVHVSVAQALLFCC